MSSRKVKQTRLQTPMHVIGAGELGTVFPPSGGKTLINLNMYTEPNGVYISFTYNSFLTELLIPYANVVGLVLEPEPTYRPAIKAVING